ncbi:MAG TPA: TetR/AcrR family transcriptional regulator [Ktedonobacteraceae bacterium]|nr:TetR/AcrR family transcriptional regulator [Ktedonobacteraceae bacterium]
MARRKQSTHEDAEKTRRNIVRIAQQLFMEYGFRAVSTRQIAAICGLTQPALYHHFADKQDLYVAMAQEEVAKLRVALERIVQQNEGMEKRLQEVMLYLLGTTQHDLHLMLHDVRHELTPERRNLLNQAFQAGVVGPIASIFEDGLRQGLLRDQQHGGVDALTSAYLFLNMVSAHLPQSGHTNRVTSDAEMAQKIVYVLLHGIGREMSVIETNT